MEHADRPGLLVCGFAEQLNPWFHAPSDKNPNEIYVGTVVLPGGTQRARAYVKIFPLESRHQLVYNEVIGHHLAIQCGLPSPQTFPCACRTTLLRSRSRARATPDTGSEFTLGVASVDGGYKDVKQRVVRSATVWADLMNWPHVARVAVFDELMGNDDRHLENLIRRGPRDYLLIDSERILFAEPWFDLDLNGLRNRRCDANILADAIAECTDEVMRQRLLQVAQFFVRSTVLTVPRVSEAIEQMCSAPPGITINLIELLNSRRVLLPSLMQWHLQKGDLFQASSKR